MQISEKAEFTPRTDSTLPLGAPLEIPRLDAKKRKIPRSGTLSVLYVGGCSACSLNHIDFKTVGAIKRPIVFVFDGKPEEAHLDRLPIGSHHFIIADPSLSLMRALRPLAPPQAFKIDVRDRVVGIYNRKSSLTDYLSNP